jgi:hypothetical protein
MERLPLRAYADTSVFGGVYDSEFAEWSRAFFAQVRTGRFVLLSSVIVQDELREAPGPVRDLFRGLLPLVELVRVGDEALGLRAAYLRAGVVSAQWEDDALHVALASVARAQMLLSWNYKHIVHFDKIAMYNAVNRHNGWDDIAIFSPREVIHYEDEDV